MHPSGRSRFSKQGDVPSSEPEILPRHSPQVSTRGGHSPGLPLPPGNRPDISGIGAKKLERRGSLSAKESSSMRNAVGLGAKSAAELTELHQLDEGFGPRDIGHRVQRSVSLTSGFLEEHKALLSTLKEMEAPREGEAPAAAPPYTPVIPDGDQAHRDMSSDHNVSQLAQELQELRPRIEDGPRWKLEPFLDAMDKLHDARSAIGLQMAQIEASELKFSKRSRLNAMASQGPKLGEQESTKPGSYRLHANSAEVRRKQLEGTREVVRQSAFPKSVSVGGTYATWGESSDEEGASEGPEEDPYASGSDEEDSWLEPREAKFKRQRQALEQLEKEGKVLRDLAVSQLLEEFRDALEKNSKTLDSLSLKHELEKRVATLHFQRSSSGENGARPSTSHTGGGNFNRSSSEASVQKPTRHLLFDDPMLQEFLAEKHAKEEVQGTRIDAGPDGRMGSPETDRTSLRTRLTNSDSMNLKYDDTSTASTSKSTTQTEASGERVSPLRPQGPGRPYSPPSEAWQQQCDLGPGSVDSPRGHEGKSPPLHRHASGLPLAPRGGTPPSERLQDQSADLQHQQAVSGTPGPSSMGARSESTPGPTGENGVPRAPSRERRGSDFIGGNLFGSAVVPGASTWTPAGGGWLPSDAVPWLRKMAKRLSAAGAGDQCLEVYRKVRSSALLNSLKSMEMVELRTTALDAMPWPEMESCMKGWIADLNIAAYILLDGERRLCEVVMGGLRVDWKGSLFILLLDSRIHRAIVMLSLNLQCILRSRLSPEKLFWFLNILRVVEEVTPMFEEVLLGTNKQKVLEEWSSLKQRISSGVLATLSEFKKMLREPIPPAHPVGAAPSTPGKSKRFFSAGKLLLNRVSSSDQSNTGQLGVDVTVHAVTSYVVNYILKLMERDAVFYEKLARICGEQAGVLKEQPPSGGMEMRRAASAVAARSTGTGADRSRSTGKSRPGALPRVKEGEKATPRESGEQAEAGLSQGLRTESQVQQGEGAEASPQDRAVEAEVSSLLVALEENIEARGRSYANATDFVGPALFCMNNAHYLSRCIDLCGPKDAGKHLEWIKRMESSFEEAAVTKMAAALGYPGSSANLEVSEIRTRLRNFNSCFEELALDQRNWIITSDTHRRTLRTRLAKHVKKMYSFFLTPHREILCEVPTYRWTPDGVERTVLKTFFLNCGNPVPMSF